MWGKTVARAAVLTLALSGCSGETAESRFLSALQDRGVTVQRVPTGPVTGATAQMGHIVCSRLADGQPAALVVGQVAHIHLSNDARFTTSDAEAIVSSAITELCPEHASRTQAAQQA